MFCKITIEHISEQVLSVRKVLIFDLVSLIEMGLFRLCIFPDVSFNTLCLERNHTLLSYQVCGYRVVKIYYFIMNLFYFIIYLPLSLIVINLIRCLSVLLIFLVKVTVFTFIDFLVAFPVLISMISVLIFIVYYFLLTLGFIFKIFLG